MKNTYFTLLRLRNGQNIKYMNQYEKSLCMLNSDTYIIHTYSHTLTARGKEPIRHSICDGIPRLLKKSQIHHHSRTFRLRIIVSNFKPVRNLKSRSFNIHFISIFPCSFRPYGTVRISHLFPSYCMSRLYPLWYHYRNNVWWWVQVLSLLTVKFCVCWS